MNGESREQMLPPFCPERRLSNVLGSDFDEDSDRDARAELEAIVRNVAMALAGKKINFEE